VDFDTSQLTIRICAHTFLPILVVFAVLDHNFAKIVAPTSNKNEKYAVQLQLKRRYFVEKTVKTESKLTDKQ